MDKELKQLYEDAMPGKKVVAEINPYVLSISEKQNMLDAVNLIKKKIDETIKGRTCANGSKQR